MHKLAPLTRGVRVSTVRSPLPDRPAEPRLAPLTQQNPHRSGSVTRRIACVPVWCNATFEREHRRHFFPPYPGHPGAVDFVRFTQDPLVLLENELPDLYRLEHR